MYTDLVGIELSVKPSLLTSTTTKRVGLKFDNDTITGEGVEVVSDLEKLTVSENTVNRTLLCSI